MEQAQEPAKQPMNDEERKAFRILTVACVAAGGVLAYVVFYLLERVVPMPWRPGQWVAYGIAAAALVGAVVYFVKLVVHTARYRRSFK